MNSKQLGSLIIISSVIIIGLMFFFKVQIDSQNLQTCAAMCGDSGESCGISSCPYHNQNRLTWIPILASVLVAGIGGIGIYLFFAKPEKVIQQKEYDLSRLDEEEKRAFMLIKEDKNGVYQSDLVDKLELSKVRVTRILDKLQQNNLIERKRRGMTNIVVLK